MNRDSLLALYTYNAYANNLVLESVELLSQEELTRVTSPSHESVLNLLHHLFGVEAHFLAQCQKRPTSFNPLELQTIAAIRQYAAKLTEAEQSFIASLDEAELTRPIDIQLMKHPFRFPMWQPLTQAVVHSTHHRGELSILLSLLGYPLPTLDIIVKFAEESGQGWPWEKGTARQ